MVFCVRCHVEQIDICEIDKMVVDVSKIKSFCLFFFLYAMILTVISTCNPYAIFKCSTWFFIFFWFLNAFISNRYVVPALCCISMQVL